MRKSMHAKDAVIDDAFDNLQNITHGAPFHEKFVEDAVSDLVHNGLGPPRRSLLDESPDVLREQLFWQGLDELHFLKNLEHISFSTMLRDLWSLFTRITASMDIDNIVIYRPHTKSVSWISVLYIDFLRRWGSGDTVQFFTPNKNHMEKGSFWHWIPMKTPRTSRKTMNRKYSQFQEKTLVYFDDMLYTGRQVARNIGVFDRFCHFQKVIVAAPYVGNEAFATISKNLDTDEYCVPLEIMHIRTIDNLGSKYTKLMNQNVAKVTPVFFDHSVAGVADDQNISSWKDVICDFVDCTLPFYNKLRWHDLMTRLDSMHSTLFTVEEQMRLRYTSHVRVWKYKNKKCVSRL